MLHSIHFNWFFGQPTEINLIRENVIQARNLRREGSNFLITSLPHSFLNREQRKLARGEFSKLKLALDKVFVTSNFLVILNFGMETTAGMEAKFFSGRVIFGKSPLSLCLTKDLKSTTQLFQFWYKPVSTVECFPRFCFVVKTSADNVIWQFLTFSHMN